jgi:hypothetical protein
MSNADADDWPRLRELFQIASNLDPDDRMRYLQTACPDNARLVDEVLALAARADLDRNPIRAAIGRAALEITARRSRS